MAVEMTVSVPKRDPAGDVARLSEPGTRSTARSVEILGLSTKIVVSGTRDERVAAIASQQRGRVSRRQLVAAGLSESQVTGLCRSHRMFRLHAGVYAVGHFAPTPFGAETAALLAMRPGALLSHHTAARLWGLAAVPADPELIHVLVDPRWAGRRPGLRIHRSRLIAPADRRLRERLPVTSPERALLDVAPEVDDRMLERAYDQAVVARITSARDVAQLLTRVAGHPGRQRLAEVLAADRTTTLTRSEAEEKLLALIRDADLPLPRVNQRLHGFEVDFHWPQAALIVEVDGFAFHSSRAAFERDRARDARLQAARIEVQRVTWRQLEREPFAVVARIAQALTRRGQASDGDR
jgi:very-short-patch-repair endonuclease